MKISLNQKKGKKEMRKHYYLTLDTETATLPFANAIAPNEKAKKKIAIAKPLVYDIGWIITDRKGNIVKKVSYLVQETFFVPQIFNTAYYREKRPLYMQKLAQGIIIAKCWNDIIEELVADLECVTIATAYNACFDFKKAIPFTEKYINALYSENYQEWEDYQYNKCMDIVNGGSCGKNEDYLKPIFELRNKKFPICDLWSLSCEKMLNSDGYRNYCLDTEQLTASGLYFKTSAETAFQYLTRNFHFIEEHTALCDAEIESQILTKILRKGKVTPNLDSFPFQELGKATDYVIGKKSVKYMQVVKFQIEQWLDTANEDTSFYQQMLSSIARLEYFIEIVRGY